MRESDVSLTIIDDLVIIIITTKKNRVYNKHTTMNVYSVENYEKIYAWVRQSLGINGAFLNTLIALLTKKRRRAIDSQTTLFR